MKKELVIAAYDRNYNWISLLNNVRLSVYLKGNVKRKAFPKQNEIIIEPNVGRDVHTFFYHIVNRYDTLSDYTFFSQDFPFDHVANYTEIINRDIDIWNVYSKLTLNGCWFFNSYSSIISCDSNGCPQHCGLPIKSVWENIFDSECPNTIEFVPAGHFCISKDTIYKKPKIYYENILNLLSHYEILPWVIERLEPYIFKHD